jgi:hypothetical protein
MKTADLTGAMLDYWVARGLDLRFPFITRDGDCYVVINGCGFEGEKCSPSTNWQHGGPIIEKYGIEWERQSSTDGMTSGWTASVEATVLSSSNPPWQWGETQLVAAMRAYVASKFGDTVPDEVPA